VGEQVLDHVLMPPRGGEMEGCVLRVIRGVHQRGVVADEGAYGVQVAVQCRRVDRPRRREGDIRRLHDGERHGSVHGRDLEDLTSLQLSEEDLIPLGTVRHTHPGSAAGDGGESLAR
jgi:hypothetical protein